MAASANDYLLQKLKDLDSIIRQRYDLTTEIVDGSTSEKLSGIHTRLAPLHGSSYLYKHVEMIDAALRLAIQSTKETSSAYDVDNLSWKDTVNLVRQNPALNPAKGSTYSDHPPYTWKSTGLRSPTTPREEVAHEIQTWIRGLVPDEDVRSARKIDHEHLARVVTGADVPAKKVAEDRTKKDRSERMIFVGILRFPHSTKPYFILYRIQLDVSSECDKFLGRVTSQTGSIKGVFSSQKFYLHQEVMDAIQGQVQRQAAADSSALLTRGVKPIGRN
ncbi:hypothetical protein PsYK624_048020 [Phanerochaete sordida]|uniref:Uncharacterized protein n=1 Tax=Phanerochaete sordida TaxID=48140 RepID=A0A9P3LBN0_9APHY|nr:hypothetical protein PsYK624_048020 [Phanerochaete sordida]